MANNYLEVLFLTKNFFCCEKGSEKGEGLVFYLTGFTVKTENKGGGGEQEVRRGL